MLDNHLWQAICIISLAIPVFCSAHSSYNSASPPIRTRIQASWDASPLAVQILETAALESPASFFPLLSTFVTSLDVSSIQKSPLEADLTPEEVYTRSLTLLEAWPPFQVSRSGALDSFKFSLGLKETSPLIETHYQLYKQARNASQTIESHSISYQWYGDCVEGSLDGFVTAETCRKRQSTSSLQTFDFDHVQQPSSGDATSVLLAYIDILSPEFPELYQGLFERKDETNLRIILRWKPSQDKIRRSKLVLSGYGVGLDLKRVDYITIDDRDLATQDSGKAKEQRTQKVEAEAEAGSQITEDVFAEADAEPSELIQLKSEQLLEIGVRATQLVISSPSPLTALKKLSQDFPRYAHKLITKWEPETDEDVMQELLEIQSTYIEEGRNYVWLNGMQLKSADMQPFTLLRIMRKERQRMSDLMNLGLTAKQSLELLTHPAISDAVGSEPSARGVLSVADMGDMFDASDRRELREASASLTTDGRPSADSVITYWNDIEKDARYKHWPENLQYLLQPTYPGQMPQVRRNLINVILALDFEKTISHFILAEHITPFISRGLGVRFGTVPILANNSQADLIAKASWYILENAGRVIAMDFHRELAGNSASAPTESDVRAAYKAAVEGYQTKNRRQQHATQEKTLLTFDELKEWSGLDNHLDLARRYSRRLGLATLKAPHSAGSFFVNGKPFPLNEEFRSNLQQTMQVQMQHLMQQIYFGALHDTDDISTYFYDQSTTFASRNPVILPEEGKALRFLNIAKLQQVQDLVCEGSDDSQKTSASLWLIVNVTQPETNALIEQAIKAVQDASARICIVPTSGTSDATTDMLPRPATFSWLTGDPTSTQEDSSHVLSEVTARGNRFASLTGLAGTSPAIIINGRVVDGFDANDFETEDFQALLAFEQRTRIGPVSEALNEILQTRPSSNLLAAVTSIVGQAFFVDEETSLLAKRSPKRNRVYSDIPANLTSVSLGDEDSAVLQFACIVDPLSESSQSWSAVLETLERMHSTSIRLYLNPARRTEMPLKRFYRYSVPAETTFTDSGVEASQEIVFSGVPQSTLLTLALETQHAWQAFPKESIHDLDNIRLSDLKPSARERGVEATFELSNIIVEGHARESRTGQPPRGLQLILTDGTHTTNTLVMANLGYHQLKANPGLWNYSIREGRSSEVFALDQVEGNGAARLTESRDALQVLLTTFEGITIFPKFARKPGMEEVDLLDDGGSEKSPADIKHKASEALSGLKHRMQSFFGKSEEPVRQNGLVRKKADINIFTVASGLLYERMAMIMILSVLRHTESTVKFWFIENFLSPSFKAFIPYLAEKYNFQYELVTYTWPAWLRGQKEKQRTIWGYKILFLDVLFPLELDRVIFVDSDQIVRTDLKQLVDLDLKGAPYAYAPMGDDREDMDHFRFWKGGYWAEHLRGRPYHISALYVIDLDRFRQMAAGDRLRGQYQALSADPNSLANLDQDLPNNMQAQLPIYTLDRSWLWCETWCSDESLKDAKTIDLCNNPKTHEPKLARAKRLIPEWTVYDKEIADLASQVAKANKLKVESGVNSSTARDRADDSAEAFTDEVGQLEQAREQQKEFVVEGTGGDKVESEPKNAETAQSTEGHIKGEL